MAAGATTTVFFYLISDAENTTAQAHSIRVYNCGGQHLDLVGRSSSRGKRQFGADLQYELRRHERLAPVECRRVGGTHQIDTTTGTSDSAPANLTVYVGNAPDADGDGLFDVLEANVGTDPNDTDTDNDGISDSAELGGDGAYNAGVDTNPRDADTDDDGPSSPTISSSSGAPRRSSCWSGCTMSCPPGYDFTQASALD